MIGKDSFQNDSERFRKIHLAMFHDSVKLLSRFGSIRCFQRKLYSSRIHNETHLIIVLIVRIYIADQ